MAVPEQSPETRTEYCPSCGTDQTHTVSVTLVTENDEGDNAIYSREPYRVTECRSCGRRSRRRMNDA